MSVFFKSGLRESINLKSPSLAVFQSSGSAPRSWRKLRCELACIQQTPTIPIQYACWESQRAGMYPATSDFNMWEETGSTNSDADGRKPSGPNLWPIERLWRLSFIGIVSEDMMTNPSCIWLNLIPMKWHLTVSIILWELITSTWLYVSYVICHGPQLILCQIKR